MEKEAVSQASDNGNGKPDGKSLLERYCMARLRGKGTEGLEVADEERRRAEAWLARCNDLISRAESMARMGVARDDALSELRPEAMALGREMLHGPAKGDVFAKILGCFAGPAGSKPSAPPIKASHRPPSGKEEGGARWKVPLPAGVWRNYPTDGRMEWEEVVLLDGIAKAAGWKEPERTAKLAEAIQRHADRFGDDAEKVAAAEENGALLAACQKWTYGMGSQGMGPGPVEKGLDTLRIPSRFRWSLLQNREKGEKARQRKEEARRLAAGAPAPCGAVLAGKGLLHAVAAGGGLGPAEKGTPANSILGLAPSRHWTIATDDTGVLFGNEAFQGEPQAGKYVCVLVPEGSSLPPLAPGWHAVDQELASILKTAEDLERSGAGILGIPVLALRPTNRQLWEPCLEVLLDLALRLLPLDGPTEVTLEVEQRGNFDPSHPEYLERIVDGILHRLSLSDPDRAASIRVKARIIGKRESTWNGYADLVAFSWGCAKDVRKLFRRFGWEGACLVPEDGANGDSFRRCLELLRQGGMMPEEDWNRLLDNPHATAVGSLAGALLRSFGEAAKAKPEFWRAYLDRVASHLDSKAIDMHLLERQMAWLKRYAPPDGEFPPRLRLLWLTAQLAGENHHGGTAFGSEEHEREFLDLSERLRVEDAPLVCHAALHLAVEKTDRYEFAAARELVRPWENENPAVPGLRMYARVLSSLGQHAAFEGDNAGALVWFTRALVEFEKLSERSKGEIAQTLSYAVIAAMDSASPEFPTLFSRMLHGGEPDPARDADAIRRLAGARDDRSKYAHAIALRHLAGLPPENPLRAAYAEASAGDDGLAEVSGHPWELTAFYRALLETDPAKRTAMFRRGYELAKDGGPTLKAISLVIGAGLLPSGGLSAADYLAAVDEVAAQLPAIGETRLAALRAQPGNPVPLLELARVVLPFNFR